MPDRKLILPSELRVCATCTYWDGLRSVDEELRVVVVCDSCEGECLVRELQMPAMRAVHRDAGCLWDDVHADAPPREKARAQKPTS